MTGILNQGRFSIMTKISLNISDPEFKLIDSCNSIVCVHTCVYVYVHIHVRMFQPY